jgi:hypothetical protein
MMRASAFAQAGPASATANATADIVSNLTIANVTGLQFGKIVSGATAGTVTVSPTGTRTSSGGVSPVNGATPAPSAASFTVTGEAGASYAITLPTSAITLGNGAGGTMTVDGFTSNPDGTGTLAADGHQVLDVGATLHVGASQAAGTYSGTFSVAVAYN